jgi:hypothetical protein
MANKTVDLGLQKLEEKKYFDKRRNFLGNIKATYSSIFKIKLMKFYLKLVPYLLKQERDNNFCHPTTFLARSIKLSKYFYPLFK